MGSRLTTAGLMTLAFGLGALAAWSLSSAGSAARSAPPPPSAAADEVRRLQARLEALQTEHDRLRERSRPETVRTPVEAVAAPAATAEPSRHADFDADFDAAIAAGDGADALRHLRALVEQGLMAQAVECWKRLCQGAAERCGLGQLRLLQALVEQRELLQSLLADTRQDAALRELATAALQHLDQAGKVAVLDRVFADHPLRQETGRPLVGLIDAMSGFSGETGGRHLAQLVDLIASGEHPALDHYAAIVIAAQRGASAEAAMEQLARSENATVRSMLPVLQRLARPHVDHGAYVIRGTAGGELSAGDAVIECSGQRISGWSDLHRLVAAADRGTVLSVTVVDLAGRRLVREIRGKADLRCPGRDLR